MVINPFAAFGFGTPVCLRCRMTRVMGLPGDLFDTKIYFYLPACIHSKGR